MPKTYTAAGSAVAGNVYTAAAHNVIVTDVNNFIVPPMCKLSSSAATSTTNATDTIIALGTSDFDTDSMGTTGASARITINTAGVYLVSYSVTWGTSASGSRWATVSKNGVGSPVGGTGNGWTGTVPSSTSTTNNLSSFLLSLAASDYLQLYVHQTSGGSLNAGTIGAGSFLSAIWIGRTS
jgi:hypothetical protein